MITVWGSLAGLFLYLETVYHFSSFGWWKSNPLYTLCMILATAAAETLLTGVLRGRAKKICFCFCVWAAIVWTGAQEIYLHIFKQPLLWEAVFKGGQDALTNYWREALTGMWEVLPFLLLMIAPGILLMVLLRKDVLRLPFFEGSRLRGMLLWTAAFAAGCVAVLQTGRIVQAEYYEIFAEYYDPLTLAENMGVLALFQRDTVYGTEKLARFVWDAATDREQTRQVFREQVVAEYRTEREAQGSQEAREKEEPQEQRQQPQQPAEEARLPEETESPEEETVPEEEPPVEEVPAKTHNALEIDWEVLHALADNKRQAWLADYIEGLEPTATNEYTGLFEGYNLIFLTAEGFSPYAVREDLTPVLYRMVHSGFVFDNYYVPLWQTSTSDGEYINCTGLIPDRQFSMRKSADCDMAFTLPRFFEKQGAFCPAYHDNSLSYYDRYLTHNNLGYQFKGNALGSLNPTEWGDSVFEMEDPKAWPASDLDMMRATVGEYIGKEPFCVYYMTISGHLNYNFRGNAMSCKNREAVSDTGLSENAQAYLACQIELDRALGYLLEELEAAGISERTVICLSADHYPYSMTEEQYQELAGRDLTEGMDLYRNALILWSAAREEETVHVRKACGPMDLVPTLLNLFGADFDSRMYAGRDIFSDEEGLVIFNDRSFVSDTCICRRRGREIIWLTDGEGNALLPEEERKDYLKRMEEEIKERYQFSAYLLQEDYYADVRAAMCP